MQVEVRIIHLFSTIQQYDLQFILQYHVCAPFNTLLLYIKVVFCISVTTVLVIQQNFKYVAQWAEIIWSETEVHLLCWWFTVLWFIVLLMYQTGDLLAREQGFFCYACFCQQTTSISCDANSCHRQIFNSTVCN